MSNLTHELSPALIPVLSCPVCGQALHIAEGGQSLVCAGAQTDRNPRGRAHCFDGAAAGYVPLAPRHSGGGDAKEAVRARSAFLRHGYYAPAARALTALVESVTPYGGTVLDAGCGEGYYSGEIARCGFPTIGVDLSKFAVEAAAKAARAARCAGTPTASHTLFAVGSVFALPVQDGTVDTVTNVFAPCAPAEYARVLHSGGHLIVAGAGERHLFGLKELLYDDPYLNDPRRDLPVDGRDGLCLVDTHTAAFPITVQGRAHIDALFSMTPYYWRTDRDGQARLAAVDTLTTEVVFDFHIYRKA